MAVFRVIKDKENPYVTINKYYIYDNRLSLKAKGLMSYFLSRPDDWEFYVKEIKRHTTDKDRAISNAINELINAGYINRTAKRGEKGKFSGGYDYEVYETPISTSSEENTACTENEPKRQNAEPEECRTGEMPNRQKSILLSNESKLSNEIDNSSCSSKGNMEVFKHFEKCGFGLLSPLMLEKVSADIEIYGMDWVMKAAEKSDEAGKHRYDYVKGILENWKSSGKSDDKRIKSESKKNYIQSTKKESTFNNFTQREYDFEDLEKKLLGWGD